MLRREESMPKQREMSEAARLRGQLALAEKKQRLAAALKENLRRRKIQSRERQTQTPGQSQGDTERPLPENNELKN
jgi:hypothetical protein